MNLLAKSEVFAENKLFATLDTTVRKVVVENLLPLGRYRGLYTQVAHRLGRLL